MYLTCDGTYKMYIWQRNYRLPRKYKLIILPHSAISGGTAQELQGDTTGSLPTTISYDKFISYYELINDKRLNVPACSCDIPWLFLASLFATLFGVAILPLTNSAHEVAFVRNAHALWPGAFVNDTLVLCLLIAYLNVTISAYSAYKLYHHHHHIISLL